MNGKTMSVMETSINNIYPSAFNAQFTDPKVTNNAIFNVEKSIDRDSTTECEQKTKSRKVRPSDYHWPQANIIKSNDKIDLKSSTYDQNMRKSFYKSVENIGDAIKRCLCLVSTFSDFFLNQFYHLHRYQSHAGGEFSLITAYATAGQENISEDEERMRTFVPLNTESIANCSMAQLEDIAKTCINNIQKSLKAYNKRVGILL